MDSRALLSAGLTGFAVFVWATGYRPRILAALSIPSLWLHPHMLALSLLMSAWGFDNFLNSRAARARQDRSEQETEVFLQRLSRTLANRGTLSQALDDLASSDGRILVHPDPHRVLSDLLERWQTEAMAIVVMSARLASRYGGPLPVIIDEVIKHIGRNRRQRFQRRLEEMALESTVIVLALAPYVLLLIFRVVLPTFYAILTSTALGDGVIALLGVSTLGVLGGFSIYIRREAAS